MSVKDKLRLPEFIPVIFANGEDDDSDGIQAAVNNKKVLYGDTIYQPGQDLVVAKMTLCINKLIRVPKMSRPGDRLVFFNTCTITGTGAIMYVDRYDQ